MGIQIADMGKKVVLVDADFNTPNLHMWMGIDQPHYTLRDYFQQNDLTLQQIAIETKHKNLRIVCGALADPELSNLKYFQIIKLVRELRDLDADFVIMDLGSGTAFKVSDLFLAADPHFLPHSR